MTIGPAAPARSRALTLRRLSVALLVGGLALPAVGHAFHTTFDNTAARFELDGNPSGPQDGVPDLVDEFDDGVLAPNWFVQFGSPEEMGGVLHLRSPGDHDPSSLAPWGVLLDRSDVIGAFFPCDGGGNFVATASWNPTLPVNNHVVLTFGQATSLDDLETIAVGISNWSAETASHVPWDAEGYRLSQTYVRKIGGVYDTFEVFTVPIDPGTVSNPVLLRLTFDDATNLISTAYSVDGGSTFESPWPARPTFNAASCGGISLGADPVSLSDMDGDGIIDEDDPCTKAPGAHSLPGSQLRVARINTDPVGGGNDTLLVKAEFSIGTSFSSLNPQAKGARIMLRNSSDTPRLDTTLPPGLYGGAGTRGWTLRSTGWKFIDTTGAPIAGIKRFDMRDRGTTVRVKVVGSKGTYPIVSGDEPVDVTLVLGDQSSSLAGECWESDFILACSFNGPATKLTCKR
jgi:hypothetical protein